MKLEYFRAKVAHLTKAERLELAQMFHERIVILREAGTESARILSPRQFPLGRSQKRFGAS